MPVINEIVLRMQIIRDAYSYKYKHDIGGVAYVLDTLLPGQCVLDIGSHRGEYLLFMLKLVGSTGKVFAFEPQKKLFDRLNLARLKFNWQTVTTERIAMSNYTGTAKLFLPHSSYDASLDQTVAGRITRVEEVDVTTIDEYVTRHILKPDFIKIDVEGNELKVIYGALTTLREHKPKILIEIEARHVGEARLFETFSLLNQLGYTGSFINNKSKLPLKDFQIRIHQNVDHLWMNSRKTPYCNNFVFE